MKEKLKLCAAVLIFMFCLPYLLTTILQKGAKDVKEAEETEGRLEHLTGILAKEISMESEPEALKAQAIIARTNLYRSEQEESATAPESFSAEELAELWGESCPEYMQKARTAILETANQVLMQEGELIEAAYHSVSSGQTRAASEAPGQEGKDWLAGAESLMDIRAPDYITVIFFDPEAVVQKLQGLFWAEGQSDTGQEEAGQSEAGQEEQTEEAGQSEAGQESQTEDDAEGENAWEKINELEITGRDSAGYVTEVSRGEISASGEAVRNALELPSACFYMEQAEDQLRVLVKGQGHGFGLSLYGANELAKEGKSCEEILRYYYNEAEIGIYSP